MKDPSRRLGRLVLHTLAPEAPAQVPNFGSLQAGTFRLEPLFPYATINVTKLADKDGTIEYLYQYPVMPRLVPEAFIEAGYTELTGLTSRLVRGVTSEVPGKVVGRLSKSFPQTDSGDDVAEYSYTFPSRPLATVKGHRPSHPHDANGNTKSHRSEPIKLHVSEGSKGALQVHDTITAALRDTLFTDQSSASQVQVDVRVSTEEGNATTAKKPKSKKRKKRKNYEVVARTKDGEGNLLLL